MRALVTRYVGDWCDDGELTQEVVLAVDEACTNAIRHAYDGDTEQHITLRLNQDDAGLDIVVEDTGTTAPADSMKEKPPVDPDPLTLTPGGLGMQLMYEVFDEVHWCPVEPKGNRVHLRLYK